MIEAPQQKGGQENGMDKKIFAAVFSTEFLKKILLLSAIFVLVDYLDTGVDIRIRHTISNSYGGFDINIRDNK